MILGQRNTGVNVADLGVDVVRVSEYELAQSMRLACLTILLDGLGSGVGDQAVRGVVYVEDALLVSQEVVIPDGSPPQWWTFGFDGSEGIEVPAGTIAAGMQSGPVGSGGRFYFDATAANGRRTRADTYADGAAAALAAGGPNAGRLSLFINLFEAYIPAEAIEEEELARLPFEVAQRIFGAGGVLSSSRKVARAGFHGSGLDEETGANAIVRSDGPLADLVGQRLRVSRRIGNAELEVFVYVHDEQEWPDDVTDEDMSITRRAWLELAAWPSEPIDIAVEIVT